MNEIDMKLAALRCSVIDPEEPKARSQCLKPKHDMCDFYPNCDCGSIDRLRENLSRVVQEDITEAGAQEIWAVLKAKQAAAGTPPDSPWEPFCEHKRKDQRGAVIWCVDCNKPVAIISTDR